FLRLAKHRWLNLPRSHRPLRTWTARILIHRKHHLGRPAARTRTVSLEEVIHLVITPPRLLAVVFLPVDRIGVCRPGPGTLRCRHETIAWVYADVGSINEPTRQHRCAFRQAAFKSAVGFTAAGPGRLRIRSRPRLRFAPV